MKTLRKELQDFSFVAREKKGTRVVSNKCGRDFLYFALNFYYPERFNSESNSPEEIDKQSLFGQSVHSLFAWTQIQFARAPRLLKKLDLEWFINDKKITNYFSLVKTILFSKKDFERAVKDIEDAVDNNQAVGVDLSLGIFGLLDHVLFVYGYDEENLYVFDTHTVPVLEYTLIQAPSLYKLPKAVIQKRWTQFGRIWKIKKQVTSNS